MALAKALKRSFERREYQVTHVADYDAMEHFLAGASPDFAVVDLKLVGRSGPVSYTHLTLPTTPYV